MNVTQRVESILSYSRDARNSDLELWIIYAQKSGMALTPQQLARLREMPTFETIRRVRQKIQESGRFKASESVSRQRRMKSHLMRQTMPRSTPERAEEIIEQAPVVQQLLDWIN